MDNNKRRFKLYTIDEFEEYIQSVNINRKITNQQVHHTAIPTLRGYGLAKSKEATIYSMWVYHTVNHGWQDIAQHFTICPDGIWDGRDLEIRPAGFYGAQNNGGIMAEIIGNFDINMENMSEEYKDIIYRYYAIIDKKFGLSYDIRFHRDQPRANKTCPGSSIDRKVFMEGVKLARQKLDYKDESKQLMNFLVNTVGINSKSLWANYIDGIEIINSNHVKQLIYKYLKILPIQNRELVDTITKKKLVKASDYWLAVFNDEQQLSHTNLRWLIKNMIRFSGRRQRK